MIGSSSIVEEACQSNTAKAVLSSPFAISSSRLESGGIVASSGLCMVTSARVVDMMSSRDHRYV